MRLRKMWSPSFAAVIAVCAALAADAQLVPRPQPQRSATQRIMGRGAGRTQPPAANGAQAQPASASAAEPIDNSDGMKRVEPGGSAIEFRDSPLDVVFLKYEELVGKTVLVDPSAPKVNITLQPLKGQDLSDDDKKLAIEAVLEMNNIHLEPYGEKFVRAIPRGNARKDGIPFKGPDDLLAESMHVASTKIPIKHIAVDAAIKTLENFKSPTGINIGLNDAILATDTEANLKRMQEIVAMIDIPASGYQMFFYQIEHATASGVAEILKAIVEDDKRIQEKNGSAQQGKAQEPRSSSGGIIFPRPRTGTPQQPAVSANSSVAVGSGNTGMIRGEVMIIADDQTEKIIIKTDPINTNRLAQIIRELDIETEAEWDYVVERLKYADAEEVADMVNDLLNDNSSRSTAKQNQNSAARTSASSSTSSPMVSRPAPTARSGAGKAGDADSRFGALTKEDALVLADKRINGLVIKVRKAKEEDLMKIIRKMDVKLAQVLIETVIVEVSLGDDLQTGVDWISRGKQSGQGIVTPVPRKNAAGQPLYQVKKNVYDESGELVSSTYTGDYQPQGYSVRSVNKVKTGDPDNPTEESGGYTEYVADLASYLTTARDAAAGWFSGGSTAYGLGAGMKGGMAAASAMGSIVTNFVGGGLNYILKSDKLNLGAVIQASKTDSRAKYLASPVIMTVDNKEATIEATQMRYLFKGLRSSGYYNNQDKDYEQKEIGLKVKVTPTINPNGTIMLKVDEEYSQIGEKQMIDGEPQDTTVTRKMTADVCLENSQTVVMGGLTETSISEAESGIPILKDIPWIGKWLFGSVSQNEGRKELLVFMTPYVLNNGDEAEIEAARRKKALSDQYAWTDYGWSKSKLADPVAVKEKLRRQREEWKKQDEEHAAELELDKAKLERVLKLKNRSIEDAKEHDRLVKEYIEKLNAIESKRAQVRADAEAKAHEENAGLLEALGTAEPKEAEPKEAETKEAETKEAEAKEMTSK